MNISDLLNFQDYTVWYTWMAYFGLIFGLIAGSLLGTPLLRSGLVGFAAGLVLVIILNLVMPSPAQCLQKTHGWDILRAHKICL